MAKIKKAIQAISTTIMLSTSAFALQVVEQAPVKETGFADTIPGLIVGLFIIGSFIIGCIFLLAVIMLKIYNWLTFHKRKKHDFVYSLFEDDLNRCIVGADSELKRRKKRTLWVFFKRSPIFMYNKKTGYEEISRYNGEALTKEGYYLLALYDKIGMFKVFERVLLIPLEIKDQIFKKVVIDGKKVCVIECDGFDEVDNTDFYVMPLIKDTKKDKEYLDFADKIHKEYIEKKTHRQIIKENLLSYKDDVVNAVEVNPHVHFNRRNK